jgi:hypothetical protein
VLLSLKIESTNYPHIVGMELRKTEYEEIKGLWSTWLSLKDTELEAVIQRVDATQWMDIMKRLRSIGLQEEVQQPYLTIIVEGGMRCVITGEDSVRKYCQTNKLPDSATCNMKANIRDIQPIELKDYDVRIKLKREQNVSRDDIKFQEIMLKWPLLQKSFRYIRRYSFSTAKGARFDLSIIRQSAYTQQRRYATATSFKEADILNQPLRYEVEVEAIMEGAPTEPMSFIGKIGQVLQGKQRSHAVIKNSQRMAVLNSFKSLFGQNTKFPGPKAITLEKKHLLPPAENTPDTISLLALNGGYNVTDKADGLRVLLFVYGDEKGDGGQIYLIDMNMNVYATGLVTDPAVWRGTVLDGEWVQQTKKGEPHNTFYSFDILRTRGGKDCRPLPFISSSLVPAGSAGEGASVELEARYRLLKEAVAGLSTAQQSLKLPLMQQLIIGIKHFKFAVPGTPQRQIFVEAAAMLDTTNTVPYETDGLIFTPNALALPMGIGTWAAQFKWKPVEKNTVDFLVIVEREKDEDGNFLADDIIQTQLRPDTNELVTYKTLRLYVGSVRDPAFKNPRQTILEMIALPGADTDDYRPIVFHPLDPVDVYASVCHVPIITDGRETDIAESVIRTLVDGQPITSNMIVEMSYNPAAALGWRWQPERIRWDKTEAYRRGVVGGSLNAEKVADSVWASIHDPITEEMVRGEVELAPEAEGAAAPVAVERSYVNKVDQQNEFKVKNLRAFHNFIKGTLLFGKTLSAGSALLDMGCGKIGDLHKWSSARVGWVLGIELAEDSLINPRDGAYRRYLNKKLEYPEVAPMVFVQGRCERPLGTGDSGITPDDQSLLRALYGTPGSSSKVAPFLEATGLVGKAAEKFDVISSMFTLHYFFQDRTMIDGFLQNIADNLKVGGFFVGCCFDGETVFNRLAPLGFGGVLSGKEGDTEMWSVEKLYDSLPDELTLPDSDGGLGRKIKVNFITIGDGHEEYLVNFVYLRSRLAEMGIDILTSEELTGLGLKEPSGMFKKLYDEMGGRFNMSPKLREYSFLNRWFIYRRRSYGPLSAALVGEGGLPVTAAVEVVLPVLPPSAAASASGGTRGRGRGRGGATRGGTRGGKV